MAQRGVQPLSDTLGLPDVFPHIPGCKEDQLTPDVLQHGYRHSEAAALGLCAQRELGLTLTDQPPGFYSAASLAYWRKALRQQLQGPARHLAAKRKAHLLYDAPLSSTTGGSGIGAGGSGVAPAAGLPAQAGGAVLPAAAAPGAAAAAGIGSGASAPGQTLPPPRFPQQSSRGPARREAAEAWARQQLAAPGAPPLRTLGWGSSGEAGQVPHGFPRTRLLIELLADLAPPLTRALWFLRVISLNRIRPAGWDGLSEAQQRSKQLTDDLLGFLEVAAQAAWPAGPPALRRQTSGVQLSGAGAPGQQASGSADGGRSSDRTGSMAALPPRWLYGVRLAGHCCAAGLLDAARVAEWAASEGVLVPLPAAARREMLALLAQCLSTAPLSQQQVVALAKACAHSAGAAKARAAAEAGSAPGGKQGQQEWAGLQQGLVRCAALLAQQRPAAFVPADPLPQGGATMQQQAEAEAAAVRRRLSRALHARVLHWHDAKAFQLLDEQLAAGSTAKAAAEAVVRLVEQQPEAAVDDAPGCTTASSALLRDAVRLTCEWAAAAPAADFSAALVDAVAFLGHSALRQLEQLRGVAALLPERVLYAVAVLQALAVRPQAQQHGGLAGPPLQAALQSWLDGCAGEQQQPQWRQQRLLHLALLLAEAGLLCPAAYLRSCLACGVLQPAATAAAAGGTADGSAGAICTASTGVDAAGGRSGASHPTTSSCFHLLLLEQMHPVLDYPTLHSATGSSNGSAAPAPRGRPGSSGGGSAWPLVRQQYAAARAAVLAECCKPGAAGTAAAAVAAAAAAEAAAAAAAAREWDEMLATPAPSDADDDGSSSSSQAGGSPGGHGSEQQQQRWQDASLQQLMQQLLVQLGLASAADGGTSSPGASGGLPDLLARVQQLQPWQQRHTATALLAAAKTFLATTDSGGSERRSPPAEPAASAGLAPGPSWLLQLVALLRACCGHREALSLLATCLNLLQRAVAAAVRAAMGSHHHQQPAQQGPEQLAGALTQAQERWAARSRVAPPLLLALLSAHAGSLAASDISAKLLPMLTGGLWRLQHQQHQQAARQCLAGQLELAAELLALPGSSPQQWVDKMEQQHGGAHWVVEALAQQAAAIRAGSSTSGTPLSVQQQQQQQQQAAARLQAFVRRASQLSVEALAQGGTGAAAATNGAVQPEQQHMLALLLGAQPAAAASSNGDNAVATAAALAAVQHSLAPGALPAVLQQLGGGNQGQDTAQRLLQLSPSAAVALLADPPQAYAALKQQQQHTALAGGAAACLPWHTALALCFGAGCGGSRGADDGGGSSSSLLQLSNGEAMAAAVAAATPTTARHCWLLLRLLLDEHQSHGGHRLAEAERQLAARVAQQAALRPQAAAALASTLCSLSPSAAAGQQLLLEMESLLRHPLVPLAQQATAAAPVARTASNLSGAIAIPAVPLEAIPGRAPPPPFGGEQGLVDAALVCLSTSSNPDRQHSFAQQLIKQLATLGDTLLQQPPQQHGQQPLSQLLQQPSLVAGHPVSAAAAGASPAAVQVAVWLRLALLLPLLPLVYKQRPADNSGGLRGQLLRALLRLLAAPAVRADAAAAAAAAGSSNHAAAGRNSGPSCAAGQPEAGCDTAGAAAAAAVAGQPLPQRLLHLLQALLVRDWASWMRLQGGKLRVVPAYEHSRQLAAEAAALPLPPALLTAVREALPICQSQELAAVPTCRGTAAAVGDVAALRGGSSCSGGGAPSTVSLDPWLLLEGGTDGSSQGAATAAAAAPPPVPGLLPGGPAAQKAAVPPWLDGAIKRRRRDLVYWPAWQSAPTPAPSVAEQLRLRQHGSQGQGPADPTMDRTR